MPSKKYLMEKVGGLSRPSKMPGYAWGISAHECPTGKKLVKVAGSVCADCYALKGFYIMPNTKKAHQRRLDLYRTSPTWTADMIEAIRATRQEHFRIFDSGDLQDLGMLAKWVVIAQALPNVRFWLPTKEYGIVKRFLKGGGVVPPNMVIRVSNAMKDDLTRRTLAPRVVNSAVSTKGSYTCPAPHQDNKCLDCRKCWSEDVEQVVYKTLTEKQKGDCRP